MDGKRNGKTIHTAGDGDTKGKPECKGSKSKPVPLILLDLRKQDKAIVFVTHNMELAKRCDIIYTMKDGSIESMHAD